MSFNVRSLWLPLGFEEQWGAMTDEQPAYRYAAGGLELSAVRVMNKWFEPCFLVHGHAQSARSLARIQFEMPVDVESFEQGLAWLAHGVGTCVPDSEAPRWLLEGRLLQDHLPWVRRQQAYETRPQCSVEKDWFKLAAKALRPLAATAAETDPAIFSFDGAVLRVEACSEVIAMPGIGAPWPASFAIPAIHLDHLPQRYAGASVHVSVFDGRLTIANRAWHLIEVDQSANKPEH